jgi:hypothetical protein
VTINGTAALIPAGSEAESWLKARHVENNTFGPANTQQEDPLSFFSSSPSSRDVTSMVEGDGGKKCYVEDDELRVVVVKIRDGRIADWKGGFRDWVVDGNTDTVTENAHSSLVNGT